MVSVQTFVDFIKNKDVGRIKFAIREAQFDLDSTDEDGRTALHFTVEHGVQQNDLSMTRLLLGYGADVCIRDETALQETPLHTALRLENVEATKLLLESSTFDVIRCDTFQRKKILSRSSLYGATASSSATSRSFTEQDSSLQNSVIDESTLSGTSGCCGPACDGNDINALVLVRQNSRCYIDSRLESDADIELPTVANRDVIIIQDEFVGSLPLSEIISKVVATQRLPVPVIENHLHSAHHSLTGLYVVDCRLELDDDDVISGSASGLGGGLFESLINLRTLVLSNTRLRQLPRGVATCMTGLEVLKVDGNRFEDLPAELDRLTRLTTLCLDRQRPRLRVIPPVVGRLVQLQVLSISNNRLDDLQPVCNLRCLRTLRADRNRISRLPVGLSALRDLAVLDISHNRLESIPPCLTDLIARLYFFEYYNVALRPRRCRRDRRQLVSHLELDLLLTVNRPSAVRDITIAVVGERRCGKTTLADALRRLITTSGLPSSSSTSSSSAGDFRSTGSIPDALLSADSEDGSATSLTSGWCWINIVELSCGGYMDAYVSGLDVDLILLAFDATSLHVAGAGHVHNGGAALTSRHVTRLQMWLQAIYEVSPDTPVVLLGTRADMVRSSSGAAYADIWSTIDALLETSRPHHSRRYPTLTQVACTAAVSSTNAGDDSSSGSVVQPPGNSLPVTCCCGGGSRSNCLICCRCDPHSVVPVTVARRLYAKSRAGGLGFVEVPQSFAAAVSASAANGHATPSMTVDDATSGSTCRSMVQLSSSSSSSASGARFPHVVGYFEIDSRIRKDCKSGVHHSIEHLKSALPRLATGYGVHGCASSQPISGTSTTGTTTGNCRSLVGSAGSGCAGIYRIPRSWVAFLRVLSDVSRHRSGPSAPAWLPPSTAAPFVVVEDLRMLARKCDIPTSQIQHAFNYLHRRGKIIYFGTSSNASTSVGSGTPPSGGGSKLGPCGGDDPLVRLAVVDCSWFVQRVGRVLANRLPSRCTADDIVRGAADREADIWLRQRLQLIDTESVSGTTVELGTGSQYRADANAGSRRIPTDHYDEFDSPTGRWMLAAMERLELCVELDEKTRKMKSTDIRNRLLLVPALLEYGSPSHDVWPDNPEWEERQITCDFGVRTLRPSLFAELIVRLNGPEGRRQLKIVPDPVPVFLSHHAVFFAGVDQGGCTDCYNVRRRMRARQPRVMTDADGMDITVATTAADGGDDDALHKVHVMLHSRMDAIRVQVRGTSPCCTMKAVLGFLELYLNDAPDEELSETAAAGPGADSISLDGASFSSRTTTTSTSCYGGGGGVAGTSGTGVSGGCVTTNGGGTTIMGGALTGGSEGSLGSIYPAPMPPTLPLTVGVQTGNGAAPAPTIDESFSSSATTTDDPRDLFLLCPKCVLLRHTHPGRIAYHCVSPPKRRTTAAVCRKWHNLGSWTRATTGDYRFSSVVEVPPSAAMTILPDYEHPRLVLILPPGQRLSHTDWYLFSRTRFLDGFEVHFLCEYTGYWHMTDDVGFWLSSSSHATPSTSSSSSNSASGSGKRPGSAAGSSSGSASGASCAGNQVPILLNMALSLIQIVHGIPEHSNNCRLVAPVVATLLKTYDYLRAVDMHAQPDTYAWLTKNKDRVVAMLTKVLAAASDGGMSDLYFRVNNPLNAHTVFQAPSAANRQHLARHLRIDASSGRFGSLRPIYVEREIRWVCDAHYEELRSAPT